MKKVRPRALSLSKPVPLMTRQTKESFKDLISDDIQVILTLNSSYGGSDLLQKSIIQKPFKSIRIRKRMQRKELLGVFKHSFLKRISSIKYFWRGTNPNYPSPLMKLIKGRKENVFRYEDLSCKLVNTFERFNLIHDCN